MKGIIGFSINNKFAIWIMTIIVTIGGLYAGLNMKQETIPNIVVPVLTVNTIYPGATPEEVANNLTKPLESRIKNLNGVTAFTSTSMENVSSIVVEYDYSKDMKEAESELKDAASALTPPEGAQATKISKISLNDFPVLSLSITSSKQTPEEVTKLVEEEIKPSLEGIDGIGTVSISGQQMKEVQLSFKKDRLQALGLSEDTIKAIVQASAIKAPLGIFEMEKSEKSIVVDGNVNTLEQLQNVSIPVIPSAAGAQGGPTKGAVPSGIASSQAGTALQKAPQGQAGAPISIPTVKLSEVADIKLVSIAESISRTNGEPSIGINVTKASDANTVDVVNAVKDQAAQIEKDHPGVKMIVLLDQGKPIEKSVSTMIDKALFGALFAVIVILLFLRNFRTTIISIISIPLSLVIALLVLKQMDITLNIMTLGAMTVAIGRVVDDSIVVIENNYRRMSLRSEKLKGKALVIDATREMFIPILSSTLVTIAVFLPLGTVSGPIGQIFMPFALTMVFALLASLLVAITVVPMMTNLMFRKGLKESQRHEEKPGVIAIRYRKILKWTLNHKLITFISAIVILAASFALVPKVGVSFLPDEPNKYVMVTYAPAPGQLLEDVEKTSLEAEKLIMKRAHVANLQYSIGGQSNFSVGPNKSALFYIQYESDTKDFNKEKELLVEDLKKIAPAGKWGQLDFGGGGLGGSKLSLSVYGDSFEQIKPVVAQIQALVEKNKSFEKVDTSLSKQYEQYTLVANQEKLSQYGLTAGQIAMKLSPVRQRPVLTKVAMDGKEYSVYVEVDTKQYTSIADIENETITSPLGIAVPLKDVVKVEKGTSANTVTSKNGKLYVEISANIVAKDVNKASSDLKKETDKLKLPANMSLDYGGVTAQINDTFKQLGLAIAAAIAIVYLLLVITFGGALTPFAILFSLPFTIIGALIGLYVSGETISAAAMMGALMLIGIVVTNAIVLLDRVLHMEKAGMSTREALIEAAGTRLRPILMTALATIGALLPLVLGFEGESGGLISKGLGVTVIGGLASSTVLTLLIVPIVYEFLAKFRRKTAAEE
ncbi:swarming motility protein SwrC [Paenibacillus baekrokdamisoli]|uniref:Swarming motility protein SwrC n=1 Tax=Paenibacillus baekrokdamisoli TaxID=1712516 RepID=A0A3G9IT23_9BACL|nr:efflux RND transporter permease subunit [Paenibacillus baekrokdamisoli]MBB3067628.1 HAE1 family hydrophobic/amphiphilic exporter-1 [Paenibacillus baekrokdamisoli]BBH19185.1 swarming motility protein SwrC [Paenibacillus baekrokdamisoli]